MLIRSNLHGCVRFKIFCNFKLFKKIVHFESGSFVTITFSINLRQSTGCTCNTLQKLTMILPFILNIQCFATALQRGFLSISLNKALKRFIVHREIG